jgi:hypothetical protein
MLCARIAAAVLRKRRNVICEVRGTRLLYVIPSCKTYPCQPRKAARWNTVSFNKWADGKRAQNSSASPQTPKDKYRVDKSFK